MSMHTRSKTPIVSVGIALVVGLALLLVLRGDRSGARGLEPERKPDVERAAPVGGLPVMEREPGPQPRVELAEAEPAPPAIAAPERPAEDVDAELLVVVLDAAHSDPVPGAEVQIYGLRPSDSIGTHTRWSGEARVTDRDGSVSLPYPGRIHGRDIGKVSVRVHHPAFVPYSGDFAPVAPPGVIVRLHRGGSLIVTGWIGTRDAVVTDVQAQMERRAGLDADSWIRLADGRLGNERIPGGRHEIKLTHRDAEGRTWHSALEQFDIEPGEQKELHLELSASIALEGRLSHDVPRPVRNGLVRVNAYSGTRTDGLSHSRIFDAVVEPDGSFRIEGLPIGALQLFAQCDGFVVRKETTRDRLHLGIAGMGEAQWRELREKGFPGEATYEEYLGALVDQSISRDPERARILPHFQLAAGLAPLVVEMDPTVTLAVRVLDGAELPLSGATVGASPNLTWSAIGSSQMFPSGGVHATTGADGRVVLAGLPPWSIALTVRREGYELIGEDAREGRRLLTRLGSEPGQELTLHMAPAAQ